MFSKRALVVLHSCSYSITDLAASIRPQADLLEPIDGFDRGCSKSGTLCAWASFRISRGARLVTDRYRCNRVDCPGAELFSCLSSEMHAKLSAERIARRYQPQQVVAHSETPALAVLAVHSGEVRLTREARSGTRAVVGIRGPGSLLGLREALAGTPYQVSVETTRPSILCSTPREVFIQALGACPDFALRIMRMLASDHLIAEEQLMARIHLSVAARTARLLATLDAKHQTASTNGRNGPISMNRDEMALLVGTTRETLSRSLRSMADRGLVELENGSIHLVDHAGLDAMGRDIDSQPHSR